MTRTVEHSTWRRTAGVWWLVLTSLAIAVYAPMPYLAGSLSELAARGSETAMNYLNRPAWVQAAFYTHVVFGGLALLLSPIQLAGRVRARQPCRRPPARSAWSSRRRGRRGRIRRRPRIVRSAASLGSYYYGLPMKHWLLVHEGARSRRSPTGSPISSDSFTTPAPTCLTVRACPC